VSAAGRAIGIGAALLLWAGCASPTVETAGSPTPTTAASTPPASTPAPPEDGLLGPDPAAQPGEPLLIATEDGIVSVTADGAVEEVVPDAAAIAVDDTRGGVFFQEARGRWDGQGSTEDATTIRWVTADGDAPIDLVAPESGQFLGLHDAIVLDGSAVVYYTRSEGSLPDDMVDDLVRIDPDEATVTEVREVGGWEWFSDPISVTPSLIGASSYASVARAFEFFDHRGSTVDVAGNPLAEPAFDCGSCPDLVEVSPDGSTLAHVELGEDAGGFLTIPELVLVDAGTGDELLRLRLDRPDQGWVAASLDLGDGAVVINRFVSGEVGSELDRPWVIDLGGDVPVVWEAPMAGMARLVRSPLE
jgi:hypothetical protein